MYTNEKLLQMLVSQKTSARYEAVEWLRVSRVSSPEIITALEKASQDPDKEVAERARLALKTDVHHGIAIQMGLVKPGEVATEEIQTEVLPSEVLQPEVPRQAESSAESQAVDLIQDDTFIILQILQGITFIICAILLITMYNAINNHYPYGSWTWPFACIFLPYIGLQVFSIMRYGFGNSFTYLKVMVKILFSFSSNGRR